ncbi:MAG: hypothetical protein ACTSVV_13630 [Promethearchaeota archaeon]
MVIKITQRLLKEFFKFDNGFKNYHETIPEKYVHKFIELFGVYKTEYHNLDCTSFYKNKLVYREVDVLFNSNRVVALMPENPQGYKIDKFTFDTKGKITDLKSTNASEYEFNNTKYNGYFIEKIFELMGMNTQFDNINSVKTDYLIENSKGEPLKITIGKKNKVLVVIAPTI